MPPVQPSAPAASYEPLPVTRSAPAPGRLANWFAQRRPVHIATAVLPWYHRTMYFWGGASWREHQHLRPNETLIWHAMRWGRARGVTEFDFVGGNSYKAKYGTVEVAVPWARRSRSPLVANLRDVAQQGFAFKQRAVARLGRVS